MISLCLSQTRLIDVSRTQTLLAAHVSWFFQAARLLQGKDQARHGWLKVSPSGLLGWKCPRKYTKPWNWQHFRPWKLMVGRWNFHLGNAYFQGWLCLFQGGYMSRNSPSRRPIEGPNNITTYSMMMLSNDVQDTWFRDKVQATFVSTHQILKNRSTSYAVKYRKPNGSPLARSSPP